MHHITTGDLNTLLSKLDVGPKQLWPWPCCRVAATGEKPKKYAPSVFFRCTASSGHSFFGCRVLKYLGNVWLWRWHPFWAFFCEKVPYPVHLCLWIYKYTNIHLYKYVSFIVLEYIIAPHSPSVIFTAKVHTALPCFGHHCDSSSSARSAYPRAFTPKTRHAKGVVVGGDAETESQHLMICIFLTIV